MITALTVNDFLNETASNSPAPGGGSVSALAASLGAALTSMVCRLTIGKKKYVDVQSEIEKVLKKSEELRTKFTAIIDEDTAAFNQVMAAYGMPKETDSQKAQRSAVIQEATKFATLIPLKLMELCVEAIDLVKTVSERGNQNSFSDVGVAALMIRTGCEGAALNVRINLKSIKDKPFVDANATKSNSILSVINASTQAILGRVNEEP